MYISKNYSIFNFLLIVFLSDFAVNSLDPFGFDPDNFIVDFQPYTKHIYDIDDYSFGDVKDMVGLANTRFKTLHTSSMGVIDMAHEWDMGLPEALEARAASELNKEAGELSVSVILETTLDPNNIEMTEVEFKHALSAVTDANSRFPGTVTRLSFQMKDDVPYFEYTRKFLLEHQNEIRANKLAIGLSPLSCTLLLNFDKVVDILNVIDFVFCFNIPTSYTFSEKFVRRVGSSWLNWRKQIQKINKQVDVIGHSFYTSLDQSTHKDLVRYWLAMNQWGLDNKMKIAMFSAFDLPYKPEPVKESGWFKRIRNDTTNFFSFVEKAVCDDYDCSEFRPATRRASSGGSSIRFHEIVTNEAGPTTKHVAAYVILSLGFVLFVVTMVTVIYKTTPDLKVCTKRLTKR